MQSTHGSLWDLHSVSVGLVVRVRYVRTRPSEFQQTMPAMIPAKGMARTPAGRGGGLLAEYAMVAVAVAAAAAATAAAAAAYCWGCFFFIVKMFLCGIFMCGGNWQGHTSPHTLVTLEVCRHTFGWGR